jgi:OOP family OmpA-OmpF porin
MPTRKLLYIATVLIMFGSGEVCAQEKGFYMGASLGQSRANNLGSCSDIFDIVNSCSVKSTDTGWRLFGGYQFNKHVAGELSYVDLGKFTVSGFGRVAGTPVFADASGSDKVNGFSFDAVGTLPIDVGFGLIGRIGLFAWTLDASASASGGISASTSDKPTGASLDAGLGVKYDFENNIGVRAEFQRFFSIGNDTTGKSDVDLISASVIYRFK